MQLNKTYNNSLEIVGPLDEEMKTKCREGS